MPNAAISTGIATQKIMIVPWFVTSELYSGGRHASEAAARRARERQLHAEDVDGEAADQRHHHAGEQVLHADHLVIGRPEVLLDEARLVVTGVMAVTAVGV